METRAQNAKIVVASDFLRSECWRFRMMSAVAQNSARPRRIPAARRPAGSAFLKLPATRRYRRSPAAPRAVLSTSFQIVRQCARVRTRTNARISAECSNCEQTPAPKIVCRSPFSADFPLPYLLTTLGRNTHGNKRRASPCHLLTNTTALFAHSSFPP